MTAKKVPTTFVKWLQNEKASKSKLNEYIQSLGEWFNSDYKVASNEDGSNIRKAVCAMANKDGGEVFIGISDSKKIEGVTSTPQQISQILQQPNVQQGAWFITDLNEVVYRITPIQITKQAKGKHVYVLEVRNPGIPVFAGEKGKLILYIRQGDSSFPADSYRALLWERETNREVILRTCYIEFKTLCNRISPHYYGYILGLGLRFPYLEKRMEDGSLYQYLTTEDLTFLLGKARESSGYSLSIYNDFFELKYDIERLLAETRDPGVLYGKLQERIRQEMSKIKDKIKTFGNYLEREGIHISNENRE